MESEAFNLSVTSAVFQASVLLESIIKEEMKTHFLCYHTFLPFKLAAFYIAPFLICNHVQEVRSVRFCSYRHLID